MRGGDASKAMVGRTLRNTLAVSAIAAAVAVCALTVAGHPREAIALAAGVAIGCVNGPWTVRTLRPDAPFRVVSLGRLAVLSAAGLAVGLALGSAAAVFALAGLAMAQLALAGAAFREMLR